jgi:hypothetical protein
MKQFTISVKTADVTVRNVEFARARSTGSLRQRVVVSKVKYTRKTKHKKPDNRG